MYLDYKIEQQLLKLAKNVRLNAYAPYSNFLVGSAVLCDDGSIFIGCNVENIAYPIGLCAERNALSTAIAQGKRKFTAIAIVGGKSGELLIKTTPCGMCRQFMSEFGDIIVICYDEKSDKSFQYKLSELLPQSFDF